jgi:pyocin large subunit-like protein
VLKIFFGLLIAVGLGCIARVPTSTLTQGVSVAGGPGFASPQKLTEHFRKHGAEFGASSETEYLHMAQILRDAPSSGGIREATRPDGITTRFDRRSGGFLAFNRDRTIRTFFKPNDGERYFERQLNRSHE